MPIATSTLITMAISLAISAAMMVVKLLFAQPAPAPIRNTSAVPKQADGKHNLKQAVPSRRVILGTAKVAGDYLALMERQGIAFHVLVNCSHKIDGIDAHYLHDELATFPPGGGTITSPAHFENYVAMYFRLGEDAETAYPQLVDLFAPYWTDDHRGDGLATVNIAYVSCPQEKYMTIFPQQMPIHTNVVRGALVFDPREESHDPEDRSTWTFSRNLALLRFHHITHPSGGRRSISDMYLPDWIHAANVCDETVLNREGDPEYRYHGGMEYRYENDPVEVGRKLDQAAELVLYERSDGLIGVHAGEFYDPTVRVTAKDLKEVNYDANARSSTNILAVRGRWTDPGTVYNEADAAIWGDPYIGDGTERTKSVDNTAVQTHNHIQRLQKLAMIRANAPRIALKIAYNPTTSIREIVRERFVRVHYPELELDEAVIEITGRPKRSLVEQTITLEGILIPEDLYDFDGETEEGEYSGASLPIVPEGIPVPEDFVVSIARANVNGQPQVYAVAEWDFVSTSLIYEFEWQYADAREPPQSTVSKTGELTVQSLYLANDEEYRFRLRTWSNGAPSEWTDYVTNEIAPNFYNKAAVFDGSTTYLQRSADFTGMGDAKTGTFSVWIRMLGGDGTDQVIFSTNNPTSSPRFSIYRNSSDLISVRARNAAGTVILSVNSTTTLTADGLFHHLLVSFDLSTSDVRIYLDDTNFTAVPTTLTNDTIDYTTGDWFVGSDSGGADKLNAYVTDLWFDVPYIPFGTTANRRKFINIDDNPKYLGPSGDLPTGALPLVYLAIKPEDANAVPFVTNRGSGGGMTITGSLGMTTGPGV